MTEKEPERDKPIISFNEGGSVPRLYVQQKYVRHLEERFIQRAIAQGKTVDEVIKELTPKPSSSK